MNRPYRLDPAELAALPKERRIALLRESVAEVSGRVGAVTPLSTGEAGDGPGETRGAQNRPRTTQRSEVDETARVHGERSLDVIDVPGGIGALLPRGGLAHGTVVACCGTTGVLAALLAAATAAGHGAAVIGPQRLGLLAVAELGGDLSRLALVNPMQSDPTEIANVLADGVPVVVIDPGPRGLVVPPGRARVLTQRVRSQRCVLICTGRVTGIRPDVAINARVAEYRGLGQGSGRLKEIRTALEVSGRGPGVVTGEVLLAADGTSGRSAWTLVSTPDVPRRAWGRTG